MFRSIALGCMLFVSILAVMSVGAAEVPFESGAFGGPIMKVTAINGQAGLLVGGSGSWLINHKLIIGGEGYGLASPVDANTPDTVNGKILNKVETGYGGVHFEYILTGKPLLNFSVGTLVGIGGIDYRGDPDHGHNTQSDLFFAVEPGVNVVVSATEWMRVVAGVSCRLVNGIESRITSDSDMSMPTAALNIRLGKF